MMRVFLVVPGRVAGQLQDFSRQILEHSSQVDRASGTHTLRIIDFSQVPVNMAHRELQSSPGGVRLGLGTNFSSLSSSRHGDNLTKTLHQPKTRRSAYETPETCGSPLTRWKKEFLQKLGLGKGHPTSGEALQSTALILSHLYLICIVTCHFVLFIALFCIYPIDVLFLIVFLNYFTSFNFFLLLWVRDDTINPRFRVLAC